MVKLEPVTNWHDRIVVYLEQGQPLAQACANAGVPMTIVFQHQGNDQKFKARCERATKEGRTVGFEQPGVGGHVGGTYGAKA